MSFAEYVSGEKYSFCPNHSRLHPPCRKARKAREPDGDTARSAVVTMCVTVAHSPPYTWRCAHSDNLSRRLRGTVSTISVIALCVLLLGIECLATSIAHGNNTAGIRREWVASVHASRPIPLSPAYCDALGLAIRKPVMDIASGALLAIGSGAGAVGRAPVCIQALAHPHDPLQGWKQVVNIQPYDTTTGAQFGAAVGIQNDGTSVVVASGAPAAPVDSTRTGEVWLSMPVGGSADYTGAWVTAPPLRPPAGSVVAGFGARVSLAHGPWALAVGAPAVDAVYVSNCHALTVLAASADSLPLCSRAGTFSRPLTPSNCSPCGRSWPSFALPLAQ